MTESGGSLGGKKPFTGPGGTPGGLGEAFLGLGMMAFGIFLVFDRVTVHTSFWRFAGGAGSSFGITLLPLLVGIALLFANGKSVAGWILSIVGVGLILLGVLLNLDIYFRPTTLWHTIAMFGLIAGGLGLFVKSLRAHGPPPASAG